MNRRTAGWGLAALVLLWAFPAVAKGKAGTSLPPLDGAGSTKGAGKGLRLALLDRAVAGIDIESVTFLRSQLTTALEALEATVVPYAEALDKLPDGLPAGCEDRPECLRDASARLGAGRLVLLSLRSEGLALAADFTLVEGATGQVMGTITRTFVGTTTDWAAPLGDAALALVRPPPGKIELRALVEGATVYVNGALAGLTPLPAPVDASPGRAKVLVEKEGYVPLELTLDVKIGGLARADALLVPGAAPRKGHGGVGPWWLWTGAAAVLVAGGAAVAAVLLMQAGGGPEAELGVFGASPGGAAEAGEVAPGGGRR
ncbi:MAG TPA: PEGA domain-containing protein [Myxococcota bacterium]|jgi:hypothetical protein|nr:PEGA domain-containing protein [Myxococcota bacterium]